MQRAYNNPKARERFCIAGWSFITKEKAFALCAADFLAWEWQRNYKEGMERELDGQDGGPWRGNFKLLFDGPDAKSIYGYTMGRGRTEVRALINMFYSLDRD